MKIKWNKVNKGLTLIELLIVMLLSSIVTMTVIDLVYSSGQSSDSISAENELLQDGLFASIIIANDLYKAGDLDYGLSTFSKSPFNWDTTGQYDTINDELTIKFYNHDLTTDCSGNNNIGILTNHYTVKNKILYCNDVKMLDNVERFNLSYGVDLLGDGVIDRYVNRNNAFSINEETDKRVISLKFNILISKEANNNLITKKEFNLVNGDTATFTDDKTYKYFERTVLLRNML